MRVCVRCSRSVLHARWTAVYPVASRPRHNEVASLAPKQTRDPRQALMPLLTRMSRRPALTPSRTVSKRTHSNRRSVNFRYVDVDPRRRRRGVTQGHPSRRPVRARR